MKLLSTATLAATLLSYVAADGNISKVELHQRALKVLSARKFHTIGRELGELSAECMINQEELEQTGVNEGTNDLENLSEEEALELCTVELEDESMIMECDLDDSDLTLMDSDTCVSAGGSVIKLNSGIDCDFIITKMFNMPYCLHTTCDADSYAEMMEDMMDMGDDMMDMGDDMLSMDCEYDFSISGAAIGSTTSIISIALVSLFAMLW